MATTDTIAGPAVASPHRSGPPSPDAGRHLRGDIEGLRAVAVLLVIADHLLGWPNGGFIGVDVFFVISGFLITGLLLREHRATGRISFADFYRRRIRRILPASVLVLVVTAALAHVVFFANRARETVDDAFWALLFAGNWHFASDGTDYQQAGDAVSPLQHYWSLAVEEQFYVVWPVVLLAVLGLVARRGRTGRVAVGGVAVLVVAAGYAWAVHETASAPTWAYFSTFSRSWELGLGALLAVCAPALFGMPVWLRSVLGLAGLAGIVLGALLIDSATPFPAPWALVPVLSTVAVIAAGTGGAPPLLLDNPPGRYVGGLSYSLYLWHFPAIVLLAELVPAGVGHQALVAAVTVVAATASYHLVEQPIRRSGWLRPGPRLPRRRVARLGGWTATALAAAVVAVAVVLPATGSGWPWAQAAVPAATPAPPPPLAPAPVVVTPDPVAEAAAVAAQAQAVLGADIGTALAATEWPPAVSPYLDAPAAAFESPEWAVDDCLNVTTEADLPRCSYGDPAALRTAVVLGDSVAISWMPGIRAALEPRGWRIQLLTLGQCPQVGVPVRAIYVEADFTARCTAHQQWAIEQVRLLRPDVVVLSSAANSITRLASGSTDAQALAEWREGLLGTLSALDSVPSRTVVLGTPPPGESIQDCLTRFNGPPDCVSTISGWTSDFIRTEQETVAQFRGTQLQATYVDTRPWVCDAAARCPLVVGSTPVYADGTHLVASYSARLAPLLAPALIG